MRENWHNYFMNITKVIATRSPCIRRAVGAIAVLDHRIIATGYNGVPSGLEHCTSDTCVRSIENIPSGQMAEKCRGLHAEQNLIIQCALHGVKMSGATIYCTTYPCSICAKMLINCNVRQIYYDGDYDDPLAKELFQEAATLTFKINQHDGSKIMDLKQATFNLSKRFDPTGLLAHLNPKIRNCNCNCIDDSTY